MTRHRKYYSAKSLPRREPTTAVMSAPGALRGRLTLGELVGIAALAFAHFFDWATFLVLISRHGLSAEANPIVVKIAQTAGIPGLTLAKILTVAFAAALMLLIARRRRRLAYGLLAFGIFAGLLGGFSNIASF
jgi:hypothetical protein